MIDSPETLLKASEPEVDMFLYARLNKHREAIETCPELGESYCLSQDPKGSLLLMLLYLSILISSNQIEEALDLAERHSKILPASRVVEFLPSDLPVTPKLAALLQTAFRKLVAVNRSSSVEENLRAARFLRVYGFWAEARKRHALVGEDTACSVCHRKLGDRAFALFPNNILVHVQCAEGNLSVCPVSGEQF
jgi:hypothetical protein